MTKKLMELEQRENINSSISILGSVDIAQVQQILTSIEKFQMVVQKTLNEGHDYDIIPGTSKPSLLKPGAEKILVLLGLTSEYEIIEKIENYEKGIFAYTVRCILSKNGKKVTEGLGSCNSKEDKYRWRWVSEKDLPPNVDKDMLKSKTNEYGQKLYRIENDEIFTQANTILKIAKKRAQIDAVLTVAALSEIFTQDVEDMQEFLQNEQLETMKAEEAVNVKVTFGKHKGKTLGEIYSQAPDYVQWLAQNARNDVLRKAANMVMNGKGNESQQEAQRSEDLSNNQGEDNIPGFELTEEELPF